jgi:hypothetical protein
MKVSVIIPTYNEEKWIEKLLHHIQLIIRKEKIDAEIIIVDDSNDGTYNILKKCQKRMRNLKVKHRNKVLGIGSAIKEGFKISKGDVMIVMMGDMSDDPKDIPKLIKKIEEGYDVVCGSRFIKGSYVKGYPPLKFIAHRIYNNFFSFLFNLKLKDFSNEFKAYRKEVIQRVKPESDGFEIAAEILLKSHILGFKITEVRFSCYGRSGKQSKLGSFTFSFVFLFKKLPKIASRYGKIAMKLYFEYLKRRFL